MKRARLIAPAWALICGLSTGTALAQRPIVGVKGGVTVASLVGDFAEPAAAGATFEAGSGVAAGGFLSVPVNDVLVLQPEVLFSRRVVVVHRSTGSDSEITFDWLEVPVLFKFTRGRGGRSPAVFVGPSLAFELGVTADGQDGRVSVADEVINAEFGVVVGGGIDFGRRVQVEARYRLGLTNIVKDDVFDNGVFDARDRFRSTGFMVTAGVGF